MLQHIKKRALCTFPDEYARLRAVSCQRVLLGSILAKSGHMAWFLHAEIEECPDIAQVRWLRRTSNDLLLMSAQAAVGAGGSSVAVRMSRSSSHVGVHGSGR